MFWLRWPTGNSCAQCVVSANQFSQISIPYFDNPFGGSGAREIGFHTARVSCQEVGTVRARNCSPCLPVGAGATNLGCRRQCGSNPEPFNSSPCGPETSFEKLGQIGTGKPLRHPTRPGLSLTSCRLIPTAITAGVSRVASGLLCLHAIAITTADPMELVRSSFSIVGGLPCVTVRSAPAIVVSGPAQRSLTLWPARSPSRLATLSIESSDHFVASAAVSIATGWNEPVPGREFHPLKSSAFSRRTVAPTDDSFQFASSPTLRDAVKRKVPGA